MTLLYMDGFGYLPLDTSNTQATNLLLDKARYYVVPGDVTTLPARVENLGAFTTHCLRYQNSGLDNPSFQVCSVVRPCLSSPEIFMGMRWYVENTNTRGSKPFMSLWHLETSTRLITIALQEFGVIAAYTGYAGSSGGFPAGDLLGSSSPGAFQKDEWFFLECNVVCDDTSGRVQVRVNTEVVLDLVSVNTDPDGVGNITGFGWGAEGWTNSSSGIGIVGFRCQDLYFCDTDGVLNNTYLGNVRVVTQAVIGAGSVTDFSKFGAATNWQAASNISINDTSYVFSGTPGDHDLYQVDPTVNAPLVHAVQVRGAYRMDDATQRIARNTIHTAGGNDAHGRDWYVNQTYTYYEDVIELNPDTGVQFTGLEVNALTIGPKEQA